ncbi:hypothetical protein ACE6H2_006327 [Prunus campanulata]
MRQWIQSQIEYDVAPTTKVTAPKHAKNLSTLPVDIGGHHYLEHELAWMGL